MKSQIFKKAWELFKLYNITFSHALKDAWKLAKREQVRQQFAELDVDDTEKRTLLLSQFNALKPCTYLNPIRKAVIEAQHEAFKLGEALKGEIITKYGYESWMQ